MIRQIRTDEQNSLAPTAFRRTPARRRKLRSPRALINRTSDQRRGFMALEVALAYVILFFIALAALVLGFLTLKSWHFLIMVLVGAVSP